MSHELRTPLNSVLALSRVLQMQGKNRLTDEETNYLAIIERNGKHLLSLINDILDLAKIESGRMELSIEELLLGDKIAVVAESLGPLCREKGIALVVNVDPNLPPLHSDARRVHQILQNIMGNAVKFTPTGSVTVAASHQNGQVEVTVTDTGIGIPERDLPHIFDEFRQVDGGTARSFEGSGLGLAIAARSVHLLGGRIEVQSKLGFGSTFTVTLPLTAGAADTTPTTADSSSRFKNQETRVTPAPAQPSRTVLVVDDSPEDATLIANYLSTEGYATLIAHSGKDALLLAETNRPFAITLDVIMPDLDGWEVLQRLKHNPATAAIPVIIVSLSEDRDTGLALGAVGVVSKPVNRVALLAEVRRFTTPGNASVMVVDDADLDRKLMVDMLKIEGMDVAQAKGGRQCLELLAAKVPDVLVLDLMMPEMSGFDVLDTLLNDYRTRSLPVIVVTAKDLSEEDRNHLRGRVATIVEKSRLSAGDLLKEVGRILERFAKLAPIAAAPSVAPAKRILLVEDSEPAILQIRLVLEAAGYRVDVARGGQEAFDLMGDPPPDGIILDLMMPHIDGFAVLERLRSKPTTALTPVLILTAKDLTQEDLSRLSANNVRQLIQKGDVDRRELLRQVERLLSRQPKGFV
jgi:CheY-like chemotaxis protein/two-component sensor histidine kinase